jgi:hypothetical protein
MYAVEVFSSVEAVQVKQVFGAGKGLRKGKLCLNGGFEYFDFSRAGNAGGGLVVGLLYCLAQFYL